MLDDTSTRPHDSPSPAEPPKRKPGRPKGSRTKARAATIASIMEKGDPLARLIHIMRGNLVPGPKGKNGKYTRVVPTPEQQLDAAKTLARKVLPDLRASEVTVDSNQPTLAEWLARIPNGK